MSDIEYRMHNWNARYYDKRDWGSTPPPSREYKTMLNNFLAEVKHVPSEMMARGSCTTADPLEPCKEEKEEVKEEKFLFDPKELDV